MTQLFNDPQLKRLAVPTAEMKQHQLQLKRTLMSSTRYQPAAAHKLTLGWANLMTKKPLIAAGATLGLAVAALTAVTFVAPQNSTALAQSVAKQSAAAVSKLTPEQQKSLQEKTGTLSIQAELQQAETAKDAAVLTYDEVASQYPPVVHERPAQTAPVDFHGLKYLKYTDTGGRTVILGLGADKVPVISMVMMSTGAGNGGAPDSRPTSTGQTQPGTGSAPSTGTAPAGQ